MMDPNVRSMAIQAGIQPPADYHGDETADCPWIATDDQLQRFADMLRRKYPPWVDTVYAKFNRNAHELASRGITSGVWMGVAVMADPAARNFIKIHLNEWVRSSLDERIALIMECGKP